MKILVTGSRGFIGGSVSRFAAQEGHVVLGIGHSSHAGSDWPGLYIQADVSHSDLSVAFDEFNPEVVVHAAGVASVSSSFEAPLDDLQASVSTWARTLESVRRSHVRPLIIFPSSAAVYGDPRQLPICEEALVAPISPYGFHKAAGELLAREYATCFGLSIVVLRLFSVFGERQRRLLVWELYEQLASREQIVWLQGSGTESRDYLHVDDIAAIILALAARLTGQLAGQSLIINAARGEETKVLDLARELRDLIAPGKEIRCRGQERKGDPQHWRADISLLRSLAPSWQARPLNLALARCAAAWQRETEFFVHGV